MTLETIFELLWKDYRQLNPQVVRIHDLLCEEGEEVRNDHVALRTLNFPRINLEALAQPFLDAGYEPKGSYTFTEKKLRAQHLEHREAHQPKIFLSELEIERFSEGVQKRLRYLFDPILKSLPPLWWGAGRFWDVTFADYQFLQKESEYAAWVLAFGFRANHFTISVNHLKKYADLSSLNAFIRSHGYALNESGGVIKGSANVGLAQSSTLAEPVRVSFVEGKREIPACYYEFAKRYPLDGGGLYQGFVTASADKIFESTTRGAGER